MMHEFTLAVTSEETIWADLTKIYVVQAVSNTITKIILANGMEYKVMEAAGSVVDLVRQAHKAVDVRRRGQPDAL